MTFPPSLRTYLLSHSGPIQAGAEKLGMFGRVKGRLGTLGRGTLARLFVKDLTAVESIVEGVKEKVGIIQEENEKEKLSTGANTREKRAHNSSHSRVPAGTDEGLNIKQQ